MKIAEHEGLAGWIQSAANRNTIFRVQADGESLGGIASVTHDGHHHRNTEYSPDYNQ
jgi:hypothetical protein